MMAGGCVDSSSVDSNWKTTAGEEADWRDEVIYQLLVDRFGNGDLNNDSRVVPGSLGRYQGGDWQGVIDHLDYLEKLGVTALWISPVVRNLETDANFDGYHGYWQQDFEHVNPHFGDLAKLRELVHKAHAKALQGDPRHRHQPRGAALLLRHQRQRAARRERLRRGLRRLPADGQDAVPAEPAADHAPDRVRPRLRSARRARLHFARLLGARAGELDLHPEHQPRAHRAGLERRHRAGGRLRQAGLVPQEGTHHRLQRARAGAQRRLPRRPQGPRHREPRGARGADGGVRKMDPGGRLRRVPHRHAQARGARVLAVLL